MIEAGASTTQPTDEARRRIIVLGTGTGVGKTHVACALAHAWAAAGAGTVWGCKPIESGLGAEPGGRSDAERLLEASLFHVKQGGAGQRAAGTGIEAATPLSPPADASIPAGLRTPPYAFAPPISPHLAARRDGVRIDFSVVRRWADRIQGSGRTVIETAGGLCSPLGPGTRNIDLARALAPAVWVIVASDRLGVLHDVAAAAAVLSALAPRPPTALVLSTPAPLDASTGTNAIELATLGLAEPAAVFPRDSPFSDVSRAAARALLARLGCI